MKVLVSAVLIAEALMLALVVPVAIQVAGVSAGSAWMFLGISFFLIVVAVARLRRGSGGTGLLLGWLVQGLAVAAGTFVPAMFFLGAIFTILYGAAIRFGRIGERTRAALASSPAS
jgi:hypothetical protein